MAGGKSLWDQLIAGTGDAIADIREKLVEEPWFGRALDVSPQELGQLDPGLTPHSPSEDVSAQARAITPDQPMHREQDDPGIDR